MSYGHCKKPNCQKYRNLNNKGICSNCQRSERKLPLKINISELYGHYAMTTPNGRILLQREWIEIKKKVDKFYQYTDNCIIDKHNSNVSLRKRDRNQSGYIYLLKSSNGYYKVGKAIDFEKRFKGYKREYPLKMSILCYFRVNHITRVETAIKRALSSYKKQGEWFILPQKYIDWLISFNLSPEVLTLEDVMKKLP